MTINTYAPSVSETAVYGTVNYGEYVIHTKTTNLSFLKLFQYLKSKGIRNNKFFLKLYDASLMNVDPHSKRLTTEQKLKILTECTKNPYYFLREVVRVNIPGGKTCFELHPGNLAITWAVLNSLDLIGLLPRQRYKTISIAAVLSWVYDFGTTNTHMLFGNKSLGDAKNNLRRFKEIRENLPDFLKTATLSPKDENNIESIKSDKTKNKIDVSGQPLNEEAADKQG